MRGRFIRSILLPLALAAALGACATNGVKPGFVQTASSVTPPPGSSGRVVAINDVNLQGSGGGSGSGRGPMVGGLVGGLGGAAIGAGTSGTVAGGLIGGAIGLVGGAIAGAIADNHGGVSGGRGIQVTVQSDDGQTAVVAQRDDGDVQIGDRVQIVEGPGGVPKVVRENSRAPDSQQGPPQYRQSRNYPPPSQGYGRPGGYGQSGSYGSPPSGYVPAPDYGPPPGHGPVSRDYQPPSQQDYRQSQGNYPAPQSPQDDWRYGSLN
jgi:outer membrane lipoprotein SlyB